MDFEFSEEQNIMLNSAKSLLRKEGKDSFRKAEKTDVGYSPDLWRKMVELGWMRVIFPEKYGGIGGTFLDLTLLLEEMGKALVPGPFITTMVSGLSILECGNEWQKEEFLPKIAEGRLIVSPAIFKASLTGDETKIEEEVNPKDGGFLLSGARLFVPFGHVADLLIYGADTNRGKSLFLVDVENSGINSTPLPWMGGSRPCEVIFQDVSVSFKDMLGEIGDGETIIAKMEEWGALAESAFVAGMLQQVLKMTVEYAKEREQFGRKIGSFQAIKHQCADMVIDVDQVKFLSYEAAWKLSRNLPAKKEISMAKAWASDASRRVCLLGIKIHGGTGVCEEHDMQLYFRRSKEAEVAFGDGDFHRDIVARELGL